jgi:NAD(P)-dependent dehydrogenase (short-subunit alcohol dehydrogenase family)
VPALRRAGGGTVIATSSLAGLVPLPGDAIYTLTKHAVVGYVRSAAATLAAEDIRVMALCPGFADTALIAHLRDQFAGFPLLTAEDVADGVERMLADGAPGECWYVQPGRDPGPYGFRGVPGPKGGEAPPRLAWDG